MVMVMVMVILMIMVRVMVFQNKIKLEKTRRYQKILKFFKNAVPLNQRNLENFREHCHLCSGGGVKSCHVLM